MMNPSFQFISGITEFPLILAFTWLQPGKGFFIVIVLHNKLQL